MALTRKFLKAMGIEDDKIEQIIEAHSESIEGIKQERDALKDASERTTAAEDKVKELTAEIEKLKNSGNDAAKVQAAFDAFKAEVEAKETNAAKVAAVRSALKDAGVQRDAFLDLLLPQIDLNSVAMAEGKLTNMDDIINPVREKYSDCFASTNNRGTPPANPPSNNGGTMTKEGFGKLTLAEQMSFANEHPKEYAALK